MKHKSNEKRYIPSLRFRWLTPFYDSLLNWTMPEKFLKRQLIKSAKIQAGRRVLDLCCE